MTTMKSTMLFCAMAVKSVLILGTDGTPSFRCPRVQQNPNENNGKRGEIQPRELNFERDVADDKTVNISREQGEIK
eukprot:m.65546 g.65546  ORF g.65546 m.65546 type:complete len:76 (+) comp23573_c0_seq1:165-392(+)